MVGVRRQINKPSAQHGDITIRQSLLPALQTAWNDPSDLSYELMDHFSLAEEKIMEGSHCEICRKGCQYVNLCCQPWAPSDLDSRDLYWLDCFMLMPACHAVALLGFWYETQTQPKHFLPQDFCYHYYCSKTLIDMNILTGVLHHLLWSNLPLLSKNT